MDIKKTIALGYNNLELIGANSLNLKYKTDYDYQLKLTVGESDEAWYEKVKQFQDMFLALNEDPNVYIMDFKAGMFRGLPVRWSSEDIALGYKQMDKRKRYTLVSAFQSKSIVKIDIVYYVDKQFEESSVNYYFNQGELDKKTILKSLILDMKKYRDMGNKMKFYKRVLSYRVLRGQNVKKLVKLFNSYYGKLYSMKHGLETIKDVFGKYPDINIKILNDAIKFIYKKEKVQYVPVEKEHIKEVLDVNIKQLSDALNENVVL
jgi:hypothetical protein